jgi:hypothetical protein
VTTCYINTDRFLNTRILCHIANRVNLHADNHRTSASRVVLSAILISLESGSINFSSTYSRTPLTQTLVIRVANYPKRLGPSGKHFLTVTVPHLFMA